MDDARTIQIEQLRQAVRARDDFIAIAAHEMRNPMTSLLGVVDLALATARVDTSCPPRITLLLERMCGIVQDYIQRATRLLDVSRIESGNLRLHPTVTDFSIIVLSIAQRYASTKRGRSHLELNVADDVCGIWDRLAVEQVAENLLSNALKFGLGRPVTVRLRPDDVGRMAQLEVQDRGVGMSQDQQACIFGRFEQVVTQHRGSGFGIGLWVSNQLVVAMGGRIAVTSSLGEGSTFIVTIPLVPPEQVTTHADEVEMDIPERIPSLVRGSTQSYTVVSCVAASI